MTDPYDPDQVEQKRARRRAKVDGDQTDLQWLLADARGRRVLARILNETGIMRPSFTPGDPLGTAYNEGRRSIGIALNTVLTSVRDDALKIILQEPLPPHE